MDVKLSLSHSLCLDNVEVDYKEHLVLKEELARTDLSEDGALKHARQQVAWILVVW